MYYRLCLDAGHRHPVTAEGRTTEPENGYLKRGTPKWAFLETRHVIISLIRSIL